MSQDREGGDGAARPLAYALPRPRLTSVLDRRSALTIVSGPAGAGKSVLLAQWTRSRIADGEVVVRLAFDEVPNETVILRALYAQLIELDLVAERSDAASLLRGFESIRDRRTIVDQAFADLIRPCILIIDNASYVDEIALFEQTLAVLDRAPSLRIVIATRRSITTQALQLLASADVGIIGPAQLLFTPEEAKEVIEWVSGRPAVLEGVAEISALPLSARLLGLAHVNHWEHFEFAASEREQVADAIMSHLMSESMSPDFREFLLCTAVPTAVTTEVASRLGWPDRAREHLEQAELYGLGMWESSDDGPCFIYTPALRHALLRRLEQRPAESVARVRRTVAIWAFERRRPFDALCSALAAKDYALASRLGRKAWFVLARTRAADVVALLQREHPSTFVRYPVLATIMALLLTQLGHRLRALAYFQTAAMSLRARSVDDDLVERFWTTTITSLAERFAGQFGRAQATADRVVETFEAMTSQQREDCEGAAALLLSSCGLSYLFAGRIGDAVAVLERGMTMSVADAVTILENGVTLRIPDDDGGWYHCASTLAGVHALQGRLADSRRVLDEIGAADPPAAWRTDLFGIMEQLARALVAVSDLDVDTAADRVRGVTHHLGSTELWPFIAAVQSEVLLYSNRKAEALLVVAHALERGVNSVTSDYASARVLAARAAALLALGDRPGAERSLASLASGDAARGALEGVAAVLAGEYERAFAEAGITGSAGERGAERHWRSVSLLTSAVAGARLERPQAASAAASRAIALLRDAQSLAPLAFFGHDDLRAVRDLCDAACAAFLDEYLSRNGGRQSPFAPLPPPVALTSRELAVLRELVGTSSTAAIASALFVSPNTVKVQRRSAYRKLGAATRDQALLRVAELGLFSDDD